MGWWQDFKQSYKYQKDLKEHQDYCKRQQASLDAELAKPADGACQQELNGIAFRRQQSEGFKPTPTPPQKPSFWGRLFGRIRAGSTDLPPAEQQAYDATKRAFTPASIESDSTRVSMQQEVNQNMAERLSHLKKGEDARRAAYHQALGDPPNAPGMTAVNRLGPALMEVAPEGASEQERAAVAQRNAETVTLMRNYSNMTEASQKPESLGKLDPAVCAQVTEAFANKLKPLIAHGIELAKDLREAGAAYGENDSVAWATPEVLDGIRKQYHAYMSLSDLAKTEKKGSAGALAMGTLEQADAYQRAGEELSGLFAGVRVKGLQYMDGATAEQMDTLVCAAAEVGKTPEELRGKFDTIISHMHELADKADGVVPRTPAEQSKRDGQIATFTDNLENAPMKKVGDTLNAAINDMLDNKEGLSAEEHAKRVDEAIKTAEFIMQPEKPMAADAPTRQAMDFSTLQRDAGKAAPAPTQRQATPAPAPKTPTVAPKVKGS